MKPKLTPRKSLNLLSIKSPISKTTSLQNTPDNDYPQSLHSIPSLPAPALSKVVPGTVRSFYNDFTTIDWARAFINTNKFNYQLKHNTWIDRESISWYKKVYFIAGRWLLIVLIGLVFSIIAFGIDKFEIVLVGLKHGYCKNSWSLSQVACCANSSPKSNVFRSGFVFETTGNNCENWVSWSSVFKNHSMVRLDFFIYVAATVILAVAACLITLSTKITQPASNNGSSHPVRVLYTACGSGVPEVKTILSGFVIRRFLGSYTLFAKTVTLVLAIASGMSLGKEGPYVHLATAVGNIITRFFPFIEENDALKKQILCAAASAGVALAFGSPLGGVFFILEEINNYLPSHHLFQIFFCAISSTLFLKFLNPYGTGKTVLFELNYTSDWRPIELVLFVIIGISGGVFGAAFVKFVAWWPKKFRENAWIKNRPVFEVLLIALLTGLVSFWNPYTKQASSELVLDLATSCNNELDRSLCPKSQAEFKHEILSLLFALVTKIILTFVTFGLKLPCGIYVPSMVVGALYGRIVAMLIQWVNLAYYDQLHIMSYLCTSKSKCVDLGIYSMISAGAFMAGVTRMHITLVTILFELTSSYNYVLPISVSIAVANWVGGYLEENSLYEALLVMNHYPFMTADHNVIDPFVTARDLVIEDRRFCQEDFTLGDIHDLTSKSLDDTSRNTTAIDITKSPYISTAILQEKHNILAYADLIDGCVPLIKEGNCVGLMFFSDLEFCLDNISRFKSDFNIQDDLYCRVLSRSGYSRDSNLIAHQENFNQNCLQAAIRSSTDYFSYGTVDSPQDDIRSTFKNLISLEKYVDRSPICLNYNTELSLAHLIFDKIGNRVIVLLKNGRYYAVLHKKVLIDYCRSES